MKETNLTGAKQCSASTEPIIRTEGLRKTYGDLVAVDGVDLTVSRGEIFGILGPNGAGKTTILEMIEGLRKPDEGTIEVAGYDAVKGADKLKRLIGVQLQSTAFFDYLNLRETLELFADLYGAESSQERIREILRLTFLEEKAKARVDQLSEGQQQRLSIALALVNDPQVVFLDEPSRGLDPQARRNLWGIVRDIRRRRKTVVLTTHYMEEAQILCDRVAVMDQGRIIACDTPLTLVRSLKMNATVLATAEKDLGGDLERLPGVVSVEHEGSELRLRTEDAQSTITDLMALASKRSVSLHNLSVQSANLEDVFISYTGRSLRER